MVIWLLNLWPCGLSLFLQCPVILMDVNYPSSVTGSPTMISFLTWGGDHNWILSDAGAPLTNTFLMDLENGVSSWSSPVSNYLAMHKIAIPGCPLLSLFIPSSIICKSKSGISILLRFYFRLLKVTLATSLAYFWNSWLYIKSWLLRARAHKSRNFCFSSLTFWSSWSNTFKILSQGPPLSLTSICQWILSSDSIFSLLSGPSYPQFFQTGIYSSYWPTLIISGQFNAFLLLWSSFFKNCYWLLLKWLSPAPPPIDLL